MRGDTAPKWENCWYDPAQGLDLTSEDGQHAALRRLLEAVRHIDAELTPGAPAWVWRGQSRKRWELTPSIYDRASTSEDRVAATEAVLSTAYEAGVGTHEGSSLPPLALLARLQHYGAATPLLDVSADPYVALFFAVVDAPNTPEPDDGLLFAIRQPRQEFRTDEMRPIEEILEAVNRAEPGQTFAYVPAPIDLRLRIQRGRFLLLPTAEDALKNALIMSSASDLEAVATRSVTDQKALRNVCVLRIPKEIKRDLAEWVSLNARLTVEDLSPNASDHPQLGAFAKAHSRSAYPSQPR